MCKSELHPLVPSLSQQTLHFDGDQQPENSNNDQLSAVNGVLLSKSTARLVR